MHERAAAIAKELGWSSMLELCEELSGIDLAALERQTEALLRDTEDAVRAARRAASCSGTSGFGFDELRRSDLPGASSARRRSTPRSRPSARSRRCARRSPGSGIELDAQANVIVDAEVRPTKTPRAFCAPVRVPDEVYLMISPQGGRDDYETLLHEAGHTEHFAHVEPGHCRSSAASWATTRSPRRSRSCSSTSPRARRGSRTCWASTRSRSRATREAVKLIFLRRYSAKLAYERRLHAAGVDLAAMPDEYARRWSAATAPDWTSSGTWRMSPDSPMTALAS